MSATFRQWRRTIYALKRLYGQPITICRTSNDKTDLATGIQSNDLAKVYILRAVVAPSKVLRAFAYDLSFIAANKNFTYGGFFDHSTRMVLASRRDIPSTFTVDLNDYVLFAGKRWEIKELHEYEELEIVAMLIDGQSGALPLDQTSISQSDSTGLTDGIVRT